MQGRGEGLVIHTVCSVAINGEACSCHGMMDRNASCWQETEWDNIDMHSSTRGRQFRVAGPAAGQLQGAVVGRGTSFQDDSKTPGTQASLQDLADQQRRIDDRG